MLVCDSHDDAVGDEEESSKTEGEEETIPRQVNRIAKKLSIVSVDLLFDYEDTDGSHGEKGYQVPT
jgi:hypothetical protein